MWLPLKNCCTHNRLSYCREAEPALESIYGLHGRLIQANEVAAIGLDQPRDRSVLALAQDSRLLYGLAVALLIFLGLFLGAGRQYLSLENPRIDVAHMKAIDVDYHMLYPSLEAKKTFASTFQWYREPWRADTWVAAYWRPLTMQAWWLQSHFFGEDRSFNWMRVSLGLQVIFDLLLLALFRSITRSRGMALLGLALFALPLAWLISVCPLSEQPRVWNHDLMIVQGWKDQPDLWCNCLVLGAMLLSMRGRYGLALLSTALAIGFKESGLMAFPLVLITVSFTQGFRRIPPWVYSAAVVILGLMMWGRYAAGPLVFRFHTYGRNVGGWTRYSYAMTPLGLRAITSYGQTAFALGLFGLFLWKPKRPIVWAGALLGSATVAVLLVSLQERLTWDVGFAQFLTEGLKPSLLMFAWLAVGAVLWRQREVFKWAMVLAACAFLAAVPFALATQTALHVLALGRAFQAGYGACAAAALALTIAEKLRRPAPVVEDLPATYDDPWRPIRGISEAEELVAR